MKKKSLSLAVCMIASTLSLTLYAAGHPVKMTCKEFIELEEVSRPKIVYWSIGYDSHGQPVSETLDIVENDRLIPILVEECRKNPKHLVIDKVKMKSKKIKV